MAHPDPGANDADIYDTLSRKANTANDAHAMAKLWDLVFELDAWFLIGRDHPADDGSEFVPLTSDVDGERFVAAFTDGARAEAFVAEQPDQSEAIELPLLEAVEVLADLCLAGVATGVLFNDGQAPFLAQISDIPDLLMMHTPGYSN
ncbi:MAG: hypothetical protein AAGB48_12765 [Planctomycetota bacterium]